MLTKAQARTLVREWLDDPAGKRWSDSRLDLAKQLAIDDLWTDILDLQGNITSQLHNITTTVSPGYIDLRLTTHGGQLTQRFYRVQNVVRDERVYRNCDPREFVIQSNGAVVAPDFTYFVQGDLLWLFPLDTETDVELRYSFKPTPYTSLTDGMYVPFPDGNESAYVLAASALTMAKGNIEDAGQLFSLANQAKDRLLASIRRQYQGMMVPFDPSGSGVQFGGM